MPLVRLLQDWASFTHDSILPEGTARLRWVAPYLFRARHRIREVRRRTKRRDVVPDEVPITVIDTAPPADQALSARSSCLFFGAPRPRSGRVRGWRTRSMASPCGRSPASSDGPLRRSTICSDAPGSILGPLCGGPSIPSSFRWRRDGAPSRLGRRFVAVLVSSFPSPILVDLGRAPAVLLPRQPGAARWLGRAFVGRASKRTARGPRLRPASRKPRAGRLRRHGGAREGRRVGENAPCQRRATRPMGGGVEDRKRGPRAIRGR